MSQRLEIVTSQVIAGLDFNNDTVETLVEAAFIAGAKAMDALYSIEKVDPDAALDEYVGGIAGLTQGVGAFLDSLTEEQVSNYRANLKKVIAHGTPEVETALEAFADANLDLTAAVLEVNEAIDGLTPTE